MSKKANTPAIDEDAKDEAYRDNFLQEIYEAHETYLSYLSIEADTKNHNNGENLDVGGS